MVLKRNLDEFIRLEKSGHLASRARVRAGRFLEYLKIGTYGNDSSILLVNLNRVEPNRLKLVFTEPIGEEKFLLCLSKFQ